MRRRLSIAVLPLLLVLVVRAQDGADPSEQEGETPAPRPPNIVVVVIDDMGWEDLDSTPVPVLDGLMERGRVYTNFYVHPVCSPSRAGLIFGRYAVRDGLVGAVVARGDDDIGIPLDRLSLPEVLGPAGYATACFGKWHISTKNECDLIDAARLHGFETWRAGYPTNLGRDGEASQRSWIRTDDGAQTYTKVYTGLAITDAFLEWWRAPDERPRLAVVNFLTPHEPFTPPPTDLLPPGCDERDFGRARYERAISALDTLIGRIAAEVDLENTYLFVLPDNGTPHQAKPPNALYRGYKLSPYQGGVHVPLVVLGPGVVAGTSAHLAHIVDVPGTILDLCHVAPERGFEDSRSFATSLSGDMPPREPVFMHFRFPNTAGPYQTNDWAVVDSDGWKLVSSDGRQSLYNLVSDPTESKPVQAPRHLEELRRAMRSAIEPTKP